MPTFTNFYENLKEANLRLKGTVVMYDSIPCYIYAITNHKGDGVFRVYMEPIGWDTTVPHSSPSVTDYPPDSTALGEYLDAWIVANPKHPIIRKMMNSPKFDKFRPFPLGMCNYGARTYYIERQPTRRTEQGLSRQMLSETWLSAQTDGPSPRGATIDIFSPAFKACVLAEHPSANVCLDSLQSDEFNNSAAAFHRQFAFVKGPVKTVFLAYKGDIVGILPNNDLSVLRLDKSHKHTLEVVNSLCLFNKIIF